MDGSADTPAEAPALRAETIPNGNGTVTVRLCGDLDFGSADAARRALEQLDDGIQQIVLDLSHITYLDAAGVRFLLTAQQRARTTGRDLVVRHPSKPVRRVLAITGELAAIGLADPPAGEEPESGDLRHPRDSELAPTASART
jgi:anti-anti-sigma factor